MVRNPEQLGLTPDGDPLAQSPAPLLGGPPAALKSWTLAEAWTTPSFWLLGFSLLVMFLTIPVPFVHIVAFAQDLGISHTNGALAVSVMGVSALAGNLCLGPLSDRIGRRSGMAVSLSVHIVAYLFFYSAQGLGVLYAGAAAFGFLLRRPDNAAAGLGRRLLRPVARRIHYRVSLCLGPGCWGPGGR